MQHKENCEMKSEKKEISANPDNFKNSHLKRDDQNSRNNDEGRPNSPSRPFKTQLRIISILLIIFSIFIILTIVSYSRQDIAASSITLNDLLGIIKKDPEILARQSITQNWLGLLGAYISNILINGTFGYAVLILLLLLIYFSIELYRKFRISPQVISNISFGLLLTLLISGFLGVLSKFTWIGNIPFEWYGRVGYFLAAISNNLLGITTSLILFISIIFISIFYKLNFKFSTVISNISNGIREVFKREHQPEIDKSKNFNDEGNNEAQNNIINNTRLETPKPQEPPIIREPGKHIEQISTNPQKKEDLKILIKQPQYEAQKPQPSVNYVPKIQAIDFAKITVSNPQIQKEIDMEHNLGYNEKNEDINQAAFIPEPISPNENDVNELKQSNELIEKQIPDTKETIVPSETIKQNIDLEQTINQIVQEKISNTSPLPEPPKLKKEPAKPSISISLSQPIEKQNREDLHSLIYSDYWDERIEYKFPSIELLNPPSTQNVVPSEELEMNARILQEKLETFKIVIDNIAITPGPVVTQYEFVPAPGIKISRIEALADDLAMALKAKGIRIIAPIPGKGTVGVEIPNSKPSIVRFSEVVSSEKFQNSKAKLPIALGKTINGEVYVDDLTRMPHLLIAGSTGSGKSVGINTIINSLLYKIHPSELKFVIIDPKKVELSQYSMLSQHYLATSPDIDDVIITNPKDAVIVLKAAVKEMERRYDILADAGQRNISDYNQKIKQGNLPKSENMLHYPMPYIVVIVDELADLMLTASKEIEEPITRLAQMARAVGIHLVIATQRPSVDVITGLIKANFPARIAYLVASRIDSRTILDQQGAEQLLGNGDMLIMPPGTPKPIRVQNAFISTDEVERICELIGNQKGYSEPYLLPSLEEENSDSKEFDINDRDPLFADAAHLVVQMQQASVSMLQRRMKIGYARAGRIMDELEAAGIVGSSKGSKTRDVLLDSESQLEAYL